MDRRRTIFRPRKMQLIDNKDLRLSHWVCAKRSERRHAWRLRQVFHELFHRLGGRFESTSRGDRGRRAGECRREFGSRPLVPARRRPLGGDGDPEETAMIGPLEEFSCDTNLILHVPTSLFRPSFLPRNPCADSIQAARFARFRRGSGSRLVLPHQTDDDTLEPQMIGVHVNGR